ncbi:MAG: transporter substrate-binding domain-containing protein, partial [Vulcanimicrobiaceae bacterium]
AIAVIGATFVTHAASAQTTGQPDLLARVKQQKVITIATEARLPPFEFVENGQIVGYDKDVLTEVLKDLPGVQLHQIDLPWQGILPGLDAKKFDYVVTAVTITKARADRYAMSPPVALASTDFVKRIGDTSITKPEDVVGKIVAGQTGSAPMAAVQAYNDELVKKTGKGAAKVVGYVAYDEAYADLVNGRVDAVGQTVPNALYLVKRRPGIFAVVEPGFGPKKFYAWCGRKDADSASLAKFFDDEISKLRTSGKLAELQKKWFGYEMPVPAQATPEF